MLKVSWSPDASFMSKSVYQLDVGTYQDLLTVRYCTYYRLHKPLKFNDRSFIDWKLSKFRLVKWVFVARILHYEDKFTGLQTC